MIPIPYCEPVRDAEWYEAESWTDTEESVGELRSQLKFVDLWVVLSGEPDDEVSPLARIFKQHAEKWEREVAHLSSTTKRVMHPSYQSIIGMGPAVVPLLLRDLQETHRHWFWALNYITGENPVSPNTAGDIRKMSDAWLKWGRDKGLI
jgi:hypothetical protein